MARLGRRAGVAGFVSASVVSALLTGATAVEAAASVSGAATSTTPAGSRASASVADFTYGEGFTPSELLVPFKGRWKLRFHSSQCGPTADDQCYEWDRNGPRRTEDDVEVTAGSAHSGRAIYAGTIVKAIGCRCDNSGVEATLVMRMAMRVVPAGTRGWKVRWSIGKYLTTERFDVQVRRPGSREWKTLAKRTPDPAMLLKPTKRGSHELRARTWDLGDHTRWSPISTIIVK